MKSGLLFFMTHNNATDGIHVNPEMCDTDTVIRKGFSCFMKSTSSLSRFRSRARN